MPSKYFENSIPSRLLEALRLNSAADEGALESRGSSSVKPREDGCSYSKACRSRCFIETDSEGKPVKKCEKTEQLLRHCIGRPQEILESKTEYTEEEAPNGWNLDSSGDEERRHGRFPFDSPSLPHSPYDIPSLPRRSFDGMDPFSRGFSDGFESFVQAAEGMVNDVFKQLGFYRLDEESGAKESQEDFKRVPREKRRGEGGSSDVSPPPRDHNTIPPRKPDFTGYSRDFEEV